MVYMLAKKQTKTVDARFRLNLKERCIQGESIANLAGFIFLFSRIGDSEVDFFFSLQRMSMF